MAVEDIFNDTSNLPRTIRGNMPYETLALSVKEVWGHGHGSTHVECLQKWNDAPAWIRYMVGEAKVQSSQPGSRLPTMARHLPERLRYNNGVGSDKRLQWCTGLTLVEQGGNPQASFGDDYAQSALPFRSSFSGNWPRTAWQKFVATFETTPYLVRTDAEIEAIQDAAGALYGGSREVLRFVVRNRRMYSKEQPIPAASTAGGFKDTTTGRPIGQVGIRTVTHADVQYKWVGVPVGWPPHPGWLIQDLVNPWPPLANPAAAAPGTFRPLRDSRLGYVNSTYFDTADPYGYNWQPEELLYIGYDEYRYFDAAGDYRADYTFHFKYKEGGWNKFLNALGQWVTVTLDGTATGTKPYQTFDANDLFRWVAGT